MIYLIKSPKMFKTNEIHRTKIHFTKAKRNIFALRTPKNLEPDHVFRDEHMN